MTNIASNIISLRQEIPSHVKIVAVSKTKPVEDIIVAYNAGQRIFGENRVQELVSKSELLPHDIEWHLIGHLQTNKVRQLIPHVSMIHSADSLKLLEVISSESVRAGRISECLLQFHIGTEETKSGLSFEEAELILESVEAKKLTGIKIRGVMGMATYTSDQSMIRKEFRGLRMYFGKLKEAFFKGDSFFSEISMGMSGDYRIAIEEGATIVRIGSLIFGRR